MDITSTAKDPGTTDVAGNTTVGNQGDVFYGLHYGVTNSKPTCYYKNASGWQGVGVNATTLTASEISSAVTIDPGTDKHNPPLMYVSPDGASFICKSQTTDYGNKRLLRRREYLVATPLPYITGEPNYIGNITAFNAPNNSWCDDISLTRSTNMAGWLSSSNSLIPMSYNSSVDLNNYGYDFVRASIGAKYFIGNKATSACVSRFGIQNPLGYGTFFSDMFVRTNGTLVTPQAQATTSDYDSGNSDNGNFIFDGIQGPLPLNTSYSGSIGIYIGYSHSGGSGGLMCASNSTTVSYFIPPMGLPVCTWASGAQTLRSQWEFQQTYKQGILQNSSVLSSAELNYYPMMSISTTSSTTVYNMASGFLRFNTNLLNGGSYVNYLGNVMCGVEAE